MRKTLTVILLAIAASAVATAVDAKPRRVVRADTIITCDLRGCSDTRAQRARTDDLAAKTRRARRAARNAEFRSRRAERAAETRTRRTQGIVTCDQRGCSDNVMLGRVRAQAVEPMGAIDTDDARPERPARTRQTVDANGNAIILGGRPAGCPHRFCGCEASLYVFGKIRPELNLAYNWIRYFPRTEPAPGMAAARGGHVMVLISHAGGSDWLVHDGNSGGSKTRRWVRSIRGYVIVDPHATKTVSQAHAAPAARARAEVTAHD